VRDRVDSSVEAVAAASVLETFSVRAVMFEESLLEVRERFDIAIVADAAVVVVDWAGRFGG
jgi:hypothetical protein